MNQCGTFSTSTHYRREHLESRGFNMWWKEGIVSDNLGQRVSDEHSRAKRGHDFGEVKWQGDNLKVGGGERRDA
jgi:hypothetical protein